MPLLQLSEQTVFDPADGAGVLVDGARGVYFELNPVATLMLEAALRYETAEEAVRQLSQRVDASDETLLAGMAELSEQLADNQLVEPTR
ncbi:PqqD family protein [Streptomyces albus subsp. chlorinus]|uniref:PqqD family protein n=1 Tax=Streptomyces albus TaxID=1888 RepID=UPI00157074B0|nr:PqqD family protein [Streptomyces albus]NSC24986.1 PqqD family protein [Streptomyces albus subsp. chlorinus]